MDGGTGTGRDGGSHGPSFFGVKAAKKEGKSDPVTGGPHTAHTTNPVPFVLAGEAVRGRSLKSGGRLCDIATTLLPLLGLPKTPGMDGVDLFA